ncbi:uncharacterized protein LOC143044391 [Mytilus galloprovincialis]|uniref:B box-type domain-containing protein n=1 Tax=Mytilus galloprovincialis TaxID=29158 RepID=A0A8B6CDF7_MYTGA|nr:Hypothetical predicted protein [Mytilus galloprovincialis]
MALSKAQDIIACNLCESDTKLKWKCLDCDLLMCNKCCDKVHPKFKNAKDHTIVDIKQVGVSGGVRHQDFTNIKCKIHTTQYCCIFCSSCDKPACPSCITKGHAGHTFIEIKEAYEMKVEWLKNRKRKLKMNETRLGEGDNTLDQILVRESSNCQKTLQDIQHQRDALKKEVDRYACRLIEEVNKNMTRIRESISKEKKKVLTRRQLEENKLETIEEILTTMDMSFFFENTDLIPKYFDQDVGVVNSSHNRMPLFKSGTISQSNVGTLYEDISSSNTAIAMKINKEFITGFKYCQYMAACSDGTLWIGDDAMKILHKMKPEGNILQTISTIKTELRGIAVTHNNDLLITDGQFKLKVVNGRTGKVSESKYSADPLGITDVHITSDHKVIVGAMSPGKAFPVTGRRVVIVMDQEGNHLTVYEQDKFKRNMFSYVWRITSTNTGNICVVDCLSDDYRSKVLVLCGDIVNEYVGNQVINKEDKRLQIANITTTPSDNIVVVDFDNHIHILDSSANLVYYYNIKEIGIEFPYCPIFTSAMSFYIGCYQPEGSTQKARLYEIQYSGF